MLVMAVVQGIAEFLPISSSGHLNVLFDLFKQFGTQLQTESLTLNIALHFGTLIAVFVVFWKRIWLLLTKDRRAIPLVIVATVPAVFVVLALKVIKEKTGYDTDVILESSLISGFCFPITGILLLWFSDRSGEKICRNLSWLDALVIGLVQAVAILPGLSRSGTTICAGLFRGMRRDEAATFSFLMAIPAIGGGAILESLKLMKSPEHLSQHTWFLLAIGVIVSAVVGILSLILLMKWLQQGKLKYFAYWLFLLGPVVVVWRLAVLLF